MPADETPVVATDEPSGDVISSDVRARFGRAIRKRRRELGVSQEELADRAGLHRTYLADVERGSRNVGLCNIEKIARSLEVSLSSLFADYGVEE